MRRAFCLFVLMAVTAVMSQPAAGDDETTQATLTSLAEKMAPAMARVEIKLKFQEGDSPDAGRAHRGLFQLIDQKRPLELPAYVLSDHQVLTLDPVIHSRFIESITVVHGDQRIPAHVAGWLRRNSVMLVETDQPLTDVQPLAFNAQAPEPYYSIEYSMDYGRWTVEASPLQITAYHTDAGRTFLISTQRKLVVTADGTPVGFTAGRLDTGKWTGSPLQWDWLKDEDLQVSTDKLKGVFANGILRVQLNFRSPKEDAGPRQHRRGENAQEETEQFVLGALIDSTTVVVLANLEPKRTALLERVQVYPAEGDPVQAKFLRSIEDYGVFLAQLAAPAGTPLVFADKPITDYEDDLVLSVQPKLHGKQMTPYFWHDRIGSFEQGQEGRLFPETANDDGETIFFLPDGRVVALPIERRSKMNDREGNSHGGDVSLTPIAYVLAAKDKSDPDNAPLSEAEESRLAWLGVELQPLDRDLARANNVAEQTHDGKTGAIVSFVYDNSPAAAAGVKVGDVLLRLDVPDLPRPIEVQITDDNPFAHEPFPWDQLDEVPEQYYDMIPTPWSNAENTLTRQLTDIGFGKPFKAEFVRNGEEINKDFVVTEGPRYYASADQYESKDLGLTVRELTYEVRRFFQKPADEPGVIVSHLEPGSRAAVAGVRPYEIITHVNDQPVNSAKDFSAAIAGQGDLRLSVKRMHKGRIVKVHLDSAAVAASQPATASAPAEAAATQPDQARPSAAKSSPEGAAADATQ